MRETWSESAGKRRRLKTHHDARQVSYKRFRRQIVPGGGGAGPVASTPLTTRGHCEPSFELNSVCRRLELDSPAGPVEPSQTVSNLEETVLAGDVSHSGCTTPCNPDLTQGWVWRAAAQECDSSQQAGSDTRTPISPFAVLDKSAVSLQGRLAKRLAAPSLLDDYYTNLLDCSCNGTVALALDSSVYLWNSDTSTLVGHLDPCPQQGRQSVSSLCWSGDGTVLCAGTRRGEIQLWDVEHNRKMRCLPSHLSVVRALSWKQQLLSSGSVLGRIHHLDVRAPTALVGAAVQAEAVCSLQWSPGDDWLASGSSDGLLRIWQSDIAGVTRSHQPVMTMKQPSAVKAMGWCPWQREVIATGGGWKDGELRMWDTHTGTCVTSVNTNSQICSLRWAGQKRYLVTGHGLPHHQVGLWEFPSLGLSYQLTGHSHRVLHVAINCDSTRVFSAGADQRFHIWDL